MEEKKLDIKTLVGFGLITVLLLWMIYNNSKQEEQQARTKEKEEQQQKVADKKAKQTDAAYTAAATPGDSARVAQLQGTLGAFAYSAGLPSAKDTVTTLESKLISLSVANKGGYIKELKLKGFDKFTKDSGQPVELIKDNNAALNIQFKTADNRILNTKDLYFEPTVTKEGENQVLTLKLKASDVQFLEYRYVLKPDDYMLDFSVRSQGLSRVVDTSKPLDMEWSMQTYRNEKSASYESRYTNIVYLYEESKDDKMGEGKSDEESVDDVSYIAFKQHLFTSVLLTGTPFKKAELKSETLIKDEAKDTVFTKKFDAKVPLAFKGGELNYDMNMYYGPSDYDILTSDKYEGKHLDRIMPLGWGLFGWMNRFVFIPVFGFLSTFISSFGVCIIVLTILVRLVMSPVTYKSYVSQAKMKVLKPEIAEINEKYSKDPMKKQQETMKLYNSAGVSPMAGCLPALMQIPVFYALFQFFPSYFDLRQKSFLWATDLSTYDVVYKLPFTIPVYGDHISLFPILASVAIFFYMRMTTGDQAMSAPQQEGMPDMSKVMKIMIYLSPIMMLVFFNTNPAGLSLYYFVSNLITIGIMYVIKNHIVNEEKIHALVQANKSKPKTQGRFQRKMQEMMEQAQEQQKTNNKGKK